VRVIPDPRDRPTLSIAEAGALAGLGRSKAYEEARRFIATGGAAGLPAIAFGRTLRCPTRRLLDLLCLESPATRSGPG
jgi:hypothetical protein